MNFRPTLRVGRRSTNVLTPSEESDLVKAIRAGRVDDIPGLLRNRGSKDSTILHLACRLKQVQTVKILLNANEPVDVLDMDQKSCLHRACEADSKEILQILIEREGNTYGKDRDGHTLVHTCAIYNSFECMDLLRHLDVNVKDEIGATPLHHAAHAGNTDFVVFLISLGADIRAVDNTGRQALHYAASMGDVNTMQVLITHSTEVDPLDNDRRTPAMLAAGCRQPGALELLISSGANVNLQDRIGFSALHHVADSGCETGARMLLAAGASLDLAADSGLTPLHVVASSFEGASVLYAMLEHDEYPPLECRDIYGRTPLHIAVRHGVKSCVSQLIDSDASPNACDCLGRTPLHLAVLQRQLESLDLLVKARTLDINAQDNEGRTALHYAALGNDIDSTTTLLRFGGDPNIRNKKGQSAHFYLQSAKIAQLMPYTAAFVDDEGRNLLMTLIRRGDERLLEFALRQTPPEEINRQDIYGRTALHYSCTYDASGKCTLMLIDNGADALIYCNKRLLAIHYAACYGQKTAAYYLLQINTIPWAKLQLNPAPDHLAAYYGHCAVLSSLIKVGLCRNVIRCIELAALKGNVECLEYLIRTLIEIKAGTKPSSELLFSETPEPSEIDEMLTPALSIAALALQNKSFKVILGAITRVENIKDSHGRNLLMLTSLNCRGNYSCIDSLLRHRCNIQHRDDSGRNVMFYAAFSGHEEGVQHFNLLGVDPISFSNLHKTPLHIAAAAGYPDILGGLILFGELGRYSEMSSPAESDESDDPRDNLNLPRSNRTPSDLARPASVTMKSVPNSPEINPEMRHLQRALEVQAAKQARAIQAANFSNAGKPQDEPSTSAQGTSTAPISKEGRNLFLLRDCDGFDPMHWAAFHGRSNSLIILLENSPKVYPFRPQYGVTPLHLAAFNGNLNCIKLLVQHFGVPFLLAADDFGRQVFHYLVIGKETSEASLSAIAKYLVSCGANINATDCRKRTPLMCAIQRHNTSLCEVLLDNGADPTVKDALGNLPLHCAAANSMETVAIRLVTMRPDTVNIENGEKNTALHLSANLGLTQLTRQLLANDADVYAQNANGQPPYLSWIQDAKKAECLDLILSILVYEERKELESALENERLKSGQMQFSSPISTTNRRSIIERRSRSSAISPNGIRSSISFNIDCSEISLFRSHVRTSLEPDNSSTPTERMQPDVVIETDQSEQFPH